MGTWANLVKVNSGNPDVLFALCPRVVDFYPPQDLGPMDISTKAMHSYKVCPQIYLYHALWLYPDMQETAFLYLLCDVLNCKGIITKKMTGWHGSSAQDELRPYKDQEIEMCVFITDVLFIFSCYCVMLMLLNPHTELKLTSKLMSNFALVHTSCIWPNLPKNYLESTSRCFTTWENYWAKQYLYNGKIVFLTRTMFSL